MLRHVSEDSLDPGGCIKDCLPPRKSLQHSISVNSDNAECNSGQEEGGSTLYKGKTG